MAPATGAKTGAANCTGSFETLGRVALCSLVRESTPANNAKQGTQALDGRQPEGTGETRISVQGTHQGSCGDRVGGRRCPSCCAWARGVGGGGDFAQHPEEDFFSRLLLRRAHGDLALHPRTNVRLGLPRMFSALLDVVDILVAARVGVGLEEVLDAEPYARTALHFSSSVVGGGTPTAVTSSSCVRKRMPQRGSALAGGAFFQDHFFGRKTRR